MMNHFSYNTLVGMKTIECLFDDNSIDLLPGKATKLTFTPRQKVTLTQLKKALHVTHLRMTY